MLSFASATRLQQFRVPRSRWKGKRKILSDERRCTLDNPCLANPGRPRLSVFGGAHGSAPGGAGVAAIARKAAKRITILTPSSLDRTPNWEARRPR